MSNILSYNRRTTGEGWIPLSGQYNADEIEMIADPSGGLSRTPRTAIPSPFAQMDLVKNAFQRLSTHSDLYGEAMDEKLVSDALDVAQLFFNMNDLRSLLHVVEWHRDTEIAKLKASPSHLLLGETLEMFLKQDSEAFNFDKMDRLYFLIQGNTVIGGTSPVTLFMAAPDAGKKPCNIPVEDNVMIFSCLRPLYVREERFIIYMYALFIAHPELKRLCKEVNAYLIRSFALLRDSTKNIILKSLGNPEAMDLDASARARNFISENYDLLEEGVQALGIRFASVRQRDIRKDIEASDFMMRPMKDVHNEPIPLVLQNHLNAPKDNPYQYITAHWDDSIHITPDCYLRSPEKRQLPATSYTYPWLGEADFFQSSIIRLGYVINRDAFFDGHRKTMGNDLEERDFLLPLKPLFFKYFDASYLWGTICGLPCFELRHTVTGGAETVKAILRVPVKKKDGFITLSHSYATAPTTQGTFHKQTETGQIVSLPFSISIFPFVQSPSLKTHYVQLVDRALGEYASCSLSLSFYANESAAPLESTRRERSKKEVKHVESSYYRLTESFDYIKVTMSDTLGTQDAEGFLCPLWPGHIAGNEVYTFAVDFGTTNTHIECTRGKATPEPLRVLPASHERLLATLYNGDNPYYDVIIKQEFIPKAIGEDYGFPQRSVISESDHLNADQTDEIVALCDANIPFIYEKESIGYRNRIIADLKWSVDMATSKRIHAYLTELTMLMRTKVLLENGDTRGTRIVWFYPLSMKVGRVRKMEEMWKKTFSEVFGVSPDENNLIQMPESVAPYYYYKCSSQFRGAAANVVCIDIGGGSCDAAIFEPNNDMPTILTSFRFAANVLFGDGFSDIPRGDTNPMLRKYVKYFKQIFDSDDDKYGELNGILDDITETRKSEDINAFLFSIEENKNTRGNDVFSYNKRLNEDELRKIIFIYFYAAIIYYVIRMMRHRKMDKPKSLMFSGTGSKVLDIIGTRADLETISQKIIERVYGQQFEESDFSIVMERKEPKQITCKGALLQVRDTDGCKSVHCLNRRMVDYENPLKYSYSMTGKGEVTYGDMKTQETIDEILKEVRDFNTLFIRLCEDIHVCDVFLVERKAFESFKVLVNKNLDHHFITGWKFFNKNQTEREDTDTVEDAVFFYPIIGCIRDNLIEEIKEE